MDFMDVANSYPARYQLVPIEKRVAHYDAGETWAEPSVEDAAELMRHVFTHCDEALARGQAARRLIETDYSEAGVGRVLRERLPVIAGRRRVAALKRRLKMSIDDVDALAAEFQCIGKYVPVHYLRYQRLLTRIREAVRAALPADATVLVVSRGDSELLDLDG